MAEASSSRAKRRLLPKESIILVSGSSTAKLPPGAVCWNNVGQKAFGLSSLPPSWTLPFFGVSAELYRHYLNRSKTRGKILAKWTRSITAAGHTVGIEPNDEILVRSSGCSEGMARRGNLYSATGTMHSIDIALRVCLEKLVADEDLRGEDIPLLIQKRCAPLNARGHLSNERRCYEESRDWMGESEFTDSTTSSQFQINLRHWRKKLRPNVINELSCSLSTHISEILKGPAEWASQKRARVHFEWVWDGRVVYLVQADQEPDWEGHNPVEEHTSRCYTAVAFTPQCLKRVTERDAARFSKIRNVFIYLKLRLPTAPFYILDDQKTIQGLRKGKVPSSLIADLSELVKGSLVIRTDIATSNLDTRQFLPRTDEIRAAGPAADWMIEKSNIICKSGHDSAFIFHNFIPARSAAFAYADPKSPFVQIESLWGLPEGLYYNSHDQHMVDTVKTDIVSIPDSDVPRFIVRNKKNFKPFFVSTTDNGRWETLTVKAPYDWKASLSKRECQRIAYHSRHIAATEKKPVSIMWFIGVPNAVTKCSAIPWYHEPCDLTGKQSSLTTRTKTPFDKSFVIRSARDVEQLRKVEFVTPQNRITVQPTEEKLLRDKNTLGDIGEIAKAKGAIIVLEGAILSHAYYQLRRTGAIVEVVHPFIGFEERQGFNKLVRDRVPAIILQRGERVTTDRLNDEALARALRKKLVEEAYEVLDAKDLRSVVTELADIKEVVDSLVQHLKISGADIAEQQKQKRDELGGFKDGIVLVETQTLPPTSSQSQDQPDLEGLQAEEIISKAIDEAEFRRRSESLEKRPDRRVAPGRLEVRVNISVPVTRRTWSADTPEERFGGVKGKIITGHVKATRIGSQWNFEVSVSINEAQPELL